MRGTQFIIGAILSLSSVRALAAPPGDESSTTVSPGATQTAPIPALPEQSEGRDSCQANAEMARQTDALFAKAKGAYEANDKDESIYWITRAYELSKCPEFLFIIAELHLEQAHSCLAYRSYQRYLEELPSGRNAITARRFTEELSNSCEASSSVASEQPHSSRPVPLPENLPASAAARQGHPPAQKAHPSATAWPPSRVVGWAAVGAGVIAGAAAVYYVGVEKSAENELEALWKSRVAGQTSPEAWQANSTSLESKGQRAERTAQILGVSAGVLAVGGALLVVLSHDPERPTTAGVIAKHLDLQLCPRAVHAGYTVNF